MKRWADARGAFLVWALGFHPGAGSTAVTQINRQLPIGFPVTTLQFPMIGPAGVEPAAVRGTPRIHTGRWCQPAVGWACLSDSGCQADKATIPLSASSKSLPCLRCCRLSGCQPYALSHDSRLVGFSLCADGPASPRGSQLGTEASHLRCVGIGTQRCDSHAQSEAARLACPKRADVYPVIVRWTPLHIADLSGCQACIRIRLRFRLSTL